LRPVTPPLTDALYPRLDPSSIEVNRWQIPELLPDIDIWLVFPSLSFAGHFPLARELQSRVSLRSLLSCLLHHPVLFGDVWKRPELSPRDRSLVTVACLISLYRTNETPFPLKRALENGVPPQRDRRSDHTPCFLCGILSPILGLPTGFDPKIWAENPNINNGLAYLINNPPE
jgi:hypothetical protein